MRILISIEHPAWAHQFKYVIRELEKRRHVAKVVAINKDRDLELLDVFGISYEVISDTSGKTIFDKGMIFLKTLVRIFFISLKFKPDIFIGRASPMMSINSFLFHKPHVIFEDTEHSKFCLNVAKLFSDVIFTPACFKKDLGGKHIRIKAYKELFYLHPNHFKPDQDVLTQLGLAPGEKYVILRFVAWDAHHDRGQSGLTLTAKRKLIEELEKHARIFITSEDSLPEEFERYRLTIPLEKIHDLLYYATMYIGEGATMASECAVLGTPAIYVNTLSAGTLQEQEQKYGLIYCFHDINSAQKQAIDKAIELISNNDIKQQWRSKREKMLADKIDVAQFMVNFVENYPESFIKYKERNRQP